MMLASQTLFTYISQSYGAGAVAAAHMSLVTLNFNLDCVVGIWLVLVLVLVLVLLMVIMISMQYGDFEEIYSRLSLIHTHTYTGKCRLLQVFLRLAFK